MSKVYMPPEFYKSICLSMAEQIAEYKPDMIFAVVRGGMSAAHIIAKHLKLEVGCIYPNADGIDPNFAVPGGSGILNKVVFVEDLVAQGRTYGKIAAYMKDLGVEYKFAPVIVDNSYKGDFDIYGIKSKHWLVAPYEEMEAMDEGDRGLFRNKTDTYK